MRVHEQPEKYSGSPPVKAVAVTQEESERADRLYEKYLNYMESVAAFIPADPPSEEETAFLVDVITRLARQGKQLRPDKRLFQVVRK